MAKDKSQMPIIDASIDFTIRTNLDGEKFVHFAYDNRSIGPLQVEDEEEVQAILTLKDAMIEARLYQKQTGKKKFSKYGPVPKVAVMRARSILSDEVLKEIDKAFVKKALKAKRFYPKRSQTIKVDPITKELILPDGNRVKQDQGLSEDENANTQEEETKLRFFVTEMAPLSPLSSSDDSDDENPLDKCFAAKYLPGKRKYKTKAQRRMRSKWYSNE